MKEKNYNIYLLIRFNLLLIYSFIIALNIYQNSKSNNNS